MRTISPIIKIADSVDVDPRATPIIRAIRIDK